MCTEPYILVIFHAVNTLTLVMQDKQRCEMVKWSTQVINH